MPDIGIGKLDAGQITLDTSVLRDTDLDAGKVEEDIFSKERLENLAGAQIDKRLPEIALDTGSLELDVDLQEARRLIEQEQYQQALEILARVLAASPDSHEARYLKASCHAKLLDYLDALEELAVLRRADASDKVRSLSWGLLAETRRALPPKMLLETALRIAAGDAATMADKLERLVELDPEPYVYHFLLAGVQMKTGDDEGARGTVERGLAVGSFGDEGLLRSMNEELLKRSLLDQMQRARHHFRQGRHADARKHLDSLPAAYQDLRLYRLFDGYLQGLVAARSAAERADVVPAGTFREVDVLYGYLVGEDVRVGKEALEKGAFESAIEFLNDALSMCPRYPYANFVYAAAAFKWLAEQFADGAPPELESAHAVLDTARTSARLACEDEDVRSVAWALLGAIESALDSLPDPADIELVNGLITEFNDIMKSVEQGIGELDHLKGVQERLLGVKRRLENEGARVRDPQGREAVSQLKNSVDSRLSEIREVRERVDKSEAVRKLIVEFNDTAQALQQAVKKADFDALKTIIEHLGTLRSRVVSERSRNSDPQLEELLQAIDNIVGGGSKGSGKKGKRRWGWRR